MPVEQVVVDLTTPADRADAAAGAARRFLLERGVAKPNPERDRMWQEAELLPGEAWADAVEEASRGDRSWILAFGTGVDVLAGRRTWGDAGARPTCPRCGEPLVADAFEEALAEPDRIVRCQACGRRSRLRKWLPSIDPAVGEVAVRFEGWPPLDDAFARELALAAGAERWAVVRSAG